MEVTVGPLHTAFPIGDASRVGEARRHAVQLAQEMDWDEVQAGKLALVVTELGTNLLRHAEGGRLLVAAQPQAEQIEVLSIDSGPGMADPLRNMDDGYSSGSTPGTGLGAVKRLAHSFDLHSSVPGGTLIVARVGKNAKEPAHRRAPQLHGLELGAVRVAAPGEQVSGDGWAACLDGTRGAVMLADGLGHGPLAAEAAEAAIGVFSGGPFNDLAQTLGRAHATLRSTRGAAVTQLLLDSEADSLRCAGAGNVVARVVSGVYDKSVMTQNGTVGVQMRSTVQETQIAWPAHALVVLHSDGIESRWASALLYPVLGRDPVLAAALLFRDHCRGRDDATVVVLRRRDG